MKGKARLLLISAVLILGMCFARVGATWGADASPPLTGVSPDTQTVLAQADGAAPAAPARTTTPAPTQTALPTTPSATSTTAPGTQNVPVTEVTVTAQKPKEGGVGAKAGNGFVERKQNETATQDTVTKEAISLVGGPAQTNLLKAIDLLPSVNVQSADPYGFAFSQTSIRVRGNQAIGMGTMIEGVPIWAINSPGPRADMFDLENIQSITLYRGGTPPDKGLGGMDTAGVLDIGVVKPADTFGVLAKQSVGSYGFLRSFARVDSGKLPTDTKFFLSGSYTDADKWKGDGGAPEYRGHFDFGIEQRFSPFVKAEAFVNYNEQNLYTYRSLTYAQARDLSLYQRYDYNPALTGKASQDINYYGFNYTQTTNLNAMGTLSITPTESTLITFKPYYWSEDKPAWSGLASIPGTKTPAIYDQEGKFDRFGSVLEYNTLLAGTKVKAGYWYESFNFPITQTYYTMQGSTLVYNRTIFAKPDERGNINSPYVRLDRDFFKDLHVDVGVRYLYFLHPGMTGYQSASSASNPNNNYNSFQYNEWLPYGGVSYSLNPETSIYTSYGRNYAYPQSWPQLFSNYIAAQAAYAKAGVNMQYLADQFKLGTSDNYDLGLRYNNKWFSVNPVLFYAEYQNKLFSVYDPVTTQNTAESVGKTRVYGAELEVGVNPLDNLRAFTSLSYNKSEILSNIRTGTNTFIQAKGNEAPDTPKILAKIGATYSLYGVSITPIVKYVDARYGDVQNDQRVPSYWLVDLYVNYKLPPFYKSFVDFKDVTVGLSALNIFNERYISVINSFDYTQTGSYQVGAPRAFALTLMARF